MSLKNRRVGYSAAMPEVLLLLELAISVAFAILAVRTVASWSRQPDRRHGNLAIALGSLAILILMAPALGGSGPTAQALNDITLVLFLVSGYGLLMFRDSFVPFRRQTTLLVTLLIVAVGLFGIVLQEPANPETPHTPLQSLELVAIVGSCLTLLVDLLALAMVPVLYVAFFPPAWLRRIWRQPEEDQFRHAMHDLLLYSPDRATLADRALVWTERLVGGEAAFVLESDGSVLAARGIAEQHASALSARSAFLTADGDGDGHAPWRAGSTLVIPIDLRQGRGAIVIVAGRLSPLFGDDELSRMRQYAASIAAGLDRVTLNSKIAALERAKTDFLNIASHELRGPMTVIKGYLTMLDAGALGELSPKARSVVPLLISKSDEVNWMIEQMIEAARLEEGRLALKKHRSDIIELTDSAISGVQILLSGHDLKIDTPPQPVEAEVDPDRFQMVVRNLLSNAAKYSTPGSDIDVKVGRDETMALVSVRDQGTGISKEDQSRLFTRFGRIETATAVQGTGLGLWLSREIARMHDGDLTCESDLGAGTTFTLSVALGYLSRAVE